MTSYDPTLFEGAAAHYRYGRPPYSPQLETVLTEELGLDGSGRLLDGGCGPGILTVRLAHLFEEAVGLDPDAAMLAEGRRVADERGITNIRWVQAVAEQMRRRGGHREVARQHALAVPQQVGDPGNEDGPRRAEPGAN